MAFPTRFLEELRARVSIADLVGRRVRLQRRGREHVGLCPFHKEKTPSFTVSDEKGFYHCFGCGAHGDAIRFVAETENLSFPEAVERLAATAGLEVPRESPAAAERERRAATLHAALEAACAFYERQLRMPDGKPALDYLHGRGLDDEAIRTFRLGFAPDRRGAVQAALAREEIAPELLIEAGLLKRSERDGSLYEYFRGRVMFPIGDRRGRVIAFGGRVLDGGEPKYLNSPETPVFQKGHVLYNLARAREAGRSGLLAVAEGYMDAIALDRAGIAAVAPLGTALTEEQMRALWRVVPEPVLCFDGDAAGQRAAARAVERALPLLQAGKSLRFALLPKGEDPDSLVRGGGAAAMRAVLDRAEPLAALLYRTEVGRQAPSTPERQADLLARLRQRVGAIGDADVRALYESDIAARVRESLGVSFSLHGPAAQPRRPQHPQPARAPRVATDRFRRLDDLNRQSVLAAFINHPVLASEFGEFLAAYDLPPGELDDLRREILQIAASGGEVDAAYMVSHLERVGLGRVLKSVLRLEIYMHAPYARPQAEAEQVRLGLMHVAAQHQHKLIEHDVRTRLGRVGADAAADEIDYFRSVSAAEQRRLGDEDGM